MPEPLARILSLDVIPWMVLVLPLGGFVVLALLGDWIRRDREETGAGVLACVTVGLAFGLSVFWVIKLWALPRGESGLALYAPAFSTGGPDGAVLPVDWIGVGGLRIPFALLLDQLSAVMALVVTGVGSLIHVYSLGYMAKDEDRVRYFSYLNLFTFFMLLLVMGASLPLVFVGWEGVGLCSYLLIGFWFRKKSASDAGLKAFVVNRVGDAGLILGMLLIFNAFGTVDLRDLADNAGGLAREPLWTFGPATVACLLLFLGACGKSAQIPLHVWLPDAMEGPTPVSALIHAATMVTAGVYMVARMGPLFDRSATAMTVVAVVGTATALMAATIALVQTDIKRVLAYSTISQLGYMFVACGVGAFGVAIFHLYTHAFFKALLFLGAGSVIHAMSGEQDMRRMGGLRAKIPWTFGTFVVGTAAIAGIPYLSGYFSKDEILAWALYSGRTGVFAVALATAVLTAFYMARLLLLTFFGPFRGGHEAEHHVHESPWVMLVPLIVLAAGSAVAGYVNVPEAVAPAFRKPFGYPVTPGWFHYFAYVLPFLGLVPAYYFYVLAPGARERLSATLRPLARVFEAKWFFDDVYNGFVRRVVVGGSDAVLWKVADARIIDGTLDGGARLVDAFAGWARVAQTGFVRAYVLLILGGAVALIGYLLWS
jgi:NADH-quinone oxidoreductase subunit L